MTVADERERPLPPAATARGERIRSWRRRGRDMAVLTAGSIAGQGMVVAAMPVMSRLYPPDDFGLLGVFAATTSIALVVSSFRYELAIPLPRRESDAAGLLGVALSLNALVSVIGGVVLALSGSAFVAATGAAGLRPYLWLIPVVVLVGGTYQALTYWAIRVRDYGRLARTRVSRGFATVAVTIGLGLGGISPLGLLIGNGAGQAAGVGSLALGVWRERQALAVVSWQLMVTVARRYARFPVFASGVGLLTALGVHLPTVVLAGLYGPVAAGLYVLATRVLGAPLVLIGQAIGQVYLGEAADLARGDLHLLRPVFLRITGVLAVLSVGPFAVIAMIAPPIFEAAFGQVWREAGVFAQLLTPMFMAQFAVSPLSQTLNVLERQGMQFAFHLVRTLLALASLAVVGAMDGSVRWAVGVYSMGMTASYLLFFVLSLGAIAKATSGRRERVWPEAGEVQ